MIFLLVLMLWPVVVYTQFNLYETDRKSGNEQFHYDCLIHDIYSGAFSLIWMNERTVQTIKYCHRPLTAHNLPTLDFENRLDKNFTFKELRHSNVTVNQIISWSATVDLVERYVLYLQQADIDGLFSDEVFYRCSDEWFGSRCQYSFGFFSSTRLTEIFDKIYKIKESGADTVFERVTNPSCYIHLTCDRGSPMCLDWREICNGQVDCINGGVDEAQCFQLEMNECADDEYRCQNGLCVSADLYKDDEEHPDCLDHSDEPTTKLPFDLCYKDPTFRCEERICRSDLQKFPCGDGQCVNDWNNSCVNGRSILKKASLFGKGNLSDSCWLFITCHTLIIDQLNFTECVDLLDSSNISDTDLFVCESLFQFPSIPVLYGQVRFLYDGNQSRFMQNNTILLLPDYICYDEKLCDFIPSTFVYQNLTCRHRQDIVADTFFKYDDFLRIVGHYFRRCGPAYVITNGTQHTSMYCCQNSSKCISQHHLMDGLIDCYLGDDERYEMSCSLKDEYRFRCSEGNSTCWSSSIDPDFCTINNQKQSFSAVPFQNICDGVVNLLPQEIDGKFYSDETECHSWPCDNIYTRCDAFKSCSDGRDEYDCLDTDCPSDLYPCISSFNYSMICLPMNQVNDNIVDCLGAADEYQYCHTWNDRNSSHCWIANQCISPSQLYDYFLTCSSIANDPFCQSSEEICPETSWDRHLAQSLLRQLSELKKTVKFFSLETARDYPSSEATNPVVHMNQWHPSDHTIWKRDWVEEADVLQRIWRCHRGLSALTWTGGRTMINQCFCPPAYYGDSCEYQNERVSLTLRLIPFSQRSLYVLAIMLTDQMGQINSYEQIVYSTSGGCLKKFDINLLYSTRPKNMSKTYSIHIDAFDKHTMTYHASWHLPIPFLFLPVNRIATNLIIPFGRSRNFKNCNLTCNNGGQCMKYVNVNEFFCHCHSNWSGPSCDIPIDCSDCSNDSLCVGSFNNRSICVCPEYKVGPRCLIPAPCPKDTCENNGQCIFIDNHVLTYRYFCICPDPFYGFFCDRVKTKLEITFDGIETPPYILIYIIQEFQSVGSNQILIRKLFHDQHVVTLYSALTIHMAFVKLSDDYYLATTQKSSISEGSNISTSLTVSQRCVPINELFNLSIFILPRIRRVKHYHLPCQTRADLWCFFDEVYMCLCTSENHSNCFELDRKISFACQHEDFCEHDSLCFQDDINCPSSTICICHDCYYGTRCQFYAKGFGLTLDDILRYEIQRHLTFSQQRISVKITAAVTTFMFTIGLVSGICSYLTFRRKGSQQVGCGIYLFASSITSLLIMNIFTLKFWFLILSQIDFITNRTIHQWGCKYIDFFLKLMIYTDGWLNGCVALERAYAVFTGVKFNRQESKRVAKRTLFILPLLVMVTIIHEPLYRGLYDDEEEQRIWCVTHYSSNLQKYNSTIILLHFLIPFFVNLLSALFIIIMTTRQRTASQSRLTYHQQLLQQFFEHKQILISPIALVILSLPRLIISLFSSCIKSSRNPWLYLVGYFISFIPAAFMFVIFVPPSALYSKEFKESLKICQRSSR